MSELEKSNERREQIIAKLVADALAQVSQKYGPEGQNPKAYHNLDHTLSVMKATADLCDFVICEGRMKPFYKDLLMVAAAHHDIEQDMGPENEAASAEIAAEKMKEVGIFTEIDIRTVERVILATKIEVTEEGVTQSASDNLLTQILADADLSNVGRDTDTYMHNLYNLYVELNPGKDLEDREYYDYLGKQRQFNSNHKFYTPEANVLFPGKEENIKFLWLVLLQAD